MLDLHKKILIETMKESTVEVIIFFTVRFFCCYIYFLPTLLPFIISYYREFNPLVSRATLFPMIFFIMIGYYASHFILAKLSPVIGIKGIILLSASTLVVVNYVIFLSSSLIYIWIMNFLMGISLNLGNTGALYYFQGKYDHEAKILFGKSMGGDLVGMFFWIQLSSLYINPSNVKAQYIDINGQNEQLFPKEVYSKIPSFMLILALGYLISMIVLMRYITNPDKYRFTLFEEKKANEIDDRRDRLLSFDVDIHLENFDDVSRTRRSYDFVEHQQNSKSVEEPLMINYQFELKSLPCKALKDNFDRALKPSMTNIESKGYETEKEMFEREEKEAREESIKPKFIYFSLSSVLLTTVIGFYISSFKVMGLTKLNNDSLLNIIYSCGGGLNFLLRIYSGEYFNYFGFYKSHFYCCLCSLALCISFLLTDSEMPYLFNWLHVLFRAMSGLFYLNLYNSIFFMYPKHISLFLLRYIEVIYCVSNFLSVFVNMFFVYGSNYYWVHLVCISLSIGSIEIFRRNTYLFEI